jgi:hypothetical protein
VKHGGKWCAGFDKLDRFVQAESKKGFQVKRCGRDMGLGDKAGCAFMTRASRDGALW